MVLRNREFEHGWGHACHFCQWMLSAFLCKWKVFVQWPLDVILQLCIFRITSKRSLNCHRLCAIYVCVRMSTLNLKAACWQDTHTTDFPLFPWARCRLGHEGCLSNSCVENSTISELKFCHKSILHNTFNTAVVYWTAKKALWLRSIFF